MVSSRVNIASLWLTLIIRPQCRIKGVLGVLQHPGPQFFWGPQLVGVVSWLQVCKGPALGTAPGPALALMRPCSSHSMGQIIKPVCLCPCVRLCALTPSRSHFLVDFHQNWHRRKKPKSKNEFVGDKHRRTHSPILPPTPPHFRRRGPQNTCK